jgi:hypothetical protein
MPTGNESPPRQPALYFDPRLFAREYYQALKSEAEAWPQSNPFLRAAKEVLASEVFADGALEGEPINDLPNFLHEVCLAVCNINRSSFPSKEQVCQHLEQQLAAAFLSLRAAVLVCLSSVFIEKITSKSKFARSIERLVSSFIEFQEQALQTARQAAAGFDRDPIDGLIGVFLRYKVGKSDRAIARAIARLSEIPSLGGHIITDEAVRKRLAEWRKGIKELSKEMAKLRQEEPPPDSEEPPPGSTG